ncbi:MAG: HlyD family secretion protein [Alteromonadaceae bacterium]|jgi:HlyD family secretion protein
MNTDKSSLEQLTIDRSAQDSSSISTITTISLFSAIIIAVLFYWFDSKAMSEPLVSTDLKVATDLTQTLNASVIPVSKEKPISSSPAPKNENKAVLDASGHIVARRIATVSSQVTGKLNRLTIEEGQRVVKSQVLAELDDQQAKLSYQLALAELSAKQASFNELLIVQLQQLQQSKRLSELFKNKLISEQRIEDAGFKTQQIAAQLNNKQAMIDLSTKRVELAQYQLSQHKIRAPFDGVVISKNAQVGELISAGTAGGGSIRTGVGTIVDMSSLEVEVEVGESYINRVFAGQQVLATLDAYPQWQIASEVEAIIPTADRQKASIKVRIKLLEVDGRVLPDMGVKVSFLSTDTLIAQQ